MCTAIVRKVCDDGRCLPAKSLVVDIHMYFKLRADWPDLVALVRAVY